MIRTLLVDDQHLVRAGLRMLCESTTDIQIVGEARNGAEAVRVAAAEFPDVVLMDLRMPGMPGTRATYLILQDRPATRVVVLTTFDDDAHLYPALSAGACGFLAKDATPGELIAAIRQAADGGSPFSTGVLKRLVSQAMHSQTRTEVSLPSGLTPRELDVLSAVGRGMANADIAELMHIGVTTVKTHVASLLDKTDSSNRVQLAVLAVRTGMVPEADVGGGSQVPDRER
ncbi:response regulator transcription factor [soil metagenome]